MKKLLTAAAVFAAVAIAFSAASIRAADVKAVTGNRQDRVIEEMQTAVNALATGGTLTNGLTVTGTLTATTIAGAASGLTGNAPIATLTNALAGTAAKTINGIVTATNVALTTATLGGKALGLTVLTNVLYNGITGSVTVVTYTP
jgi:hypothetical protein